MPKKPEKPSTRNPIAGALRAPQNNAFGKRVEKSTKEKQEIRDPWSKKAKYKNKPLDEASKPQSLAEFYQVGDRIKVVSGPIKAIIDRADKISKKKADDKAKAKATKHDTEGVVRTFGPEGTIGVTIGGEYHLIDPDDVELIYETTRNMSFEDLVEWSYSMMTSGVQIPISSEEQSILDKCSEKMYKSNLDEREQEVARLMVSKGVLRRGKDDMGIYFNGGAKKLTRF